MNKTVLLVLIALLINSLAVATEIPTVSFPYPELTHSGQITNLEITNCSKMLISNELTLPFQRFLVKIADDFTVSDFEYQIQNQSHLGYEELIFNYVDLPTTNDELLYSKISSALEQIKFGQEPLFVENIIKLNGINYLSLLVFPLTYSTTNNWQYNPDFIFKINGQTLTEADLLMADDILNHKTDNRNHQSLSSSTMYVVITTAELSPAFEHLLSYKNSLGISSQIKTIESITAEYFGVDPAEQLRNYLKDFYANGGTYVLLGGDETVVPIRYAFAGVSYSQPENEELQICDLYFADLDGNWDVNQNQVYGERYLDSADFIPELVVGRLPFNNSSEIKNYTDKLIQYQTNSSNRDNDYLEKAFFFTADQMRDFNDPGQHHEVAQVLPSVFLIDTLSGVEQSRGDDLNPTNSSAIELESILSDGFGLVNIINHGSFSGFSVRTSGYNNFPKSSFSTKPDPAVYGQFSNLAKNNKISFYYSLACDNGAFDKDQAPFNYEGENLVQHLLGLDSAGAVGFVANSRWGWVNSSHLLMADFYRNVFDHPGITAAEALTATKLNYSFLRDQVYGLNYFGDPMLVIHNNSPKYLTTDIKFEMDQIEISSISGGEPIPECEVILCNEGNQIGYSNTDTDGLAVFNLNLDFDATYQIGILKDGYYTISKEIIPSIATDIDDETDLNLPGNYTLAQNYPNPFNPSTTIAFELPQPSGVSLIIYNIEGQKVKTLLAGDYEAGSYAIEWDSKNQAGADIASGIYLYRLEAGDYFATKKMLLLR